MLEKFLIILASVLLIVFACSCKTKENISEMSSTGTPAESKIKSTYLVEENEENIISIKLPTDYAFNDAQNEFIADFVLSKICDISGKTFELTKSETAVEYNQNYSEYYIDVESKTTYISDNIISIVFTGLYNKKSAAHPINLFFALNFDPKTMNIVQFSSIHTIDDSLYNEFVKQGEKEILDKTGGIWPEGWESFSETLCSKETFFDGLKGKNSEIEWYYTENGIAFSYSVPFALGNHREVELQIEHK